MGELGPQYGNKLMMKKAIQLAGALIKVPRIERIGLFGSVARGERARDIDLILFNDYLAQVIFFRSRLFDYDYAFSLYLADPMRYRNDTERKRHDDFMRPLLELFPKPILEAVDRYRRYTISSTATGEGLITRIITDIPLDLHFIPETMTREYLGRYNAHTRDPMFLEHIEKDLLIFDPIGRSFVKGFFQWKDKKQTGT